MKTNWINVNDRLPDELETVFISDGKGWTTIGCRAWCGDEWLWAETNGIFYEKDGKIVSECESDDDFDVKFWYPMPKPPKI